MPTDKDYVISRGDNYSLVVSMSPATSVGGWSLNYNVGNHFGGAGDLIQCSISSGIPNGASGIMIQNSGQGIFAIALTPANTSGLQYGNYASWIKKTGPGNVITISEGFLLVEP